ncbi:protein of unknown function (plasmid) [Rhodovastum atsumiense]|nr:protein of unknown function [Rhodovastum atsumiense]
MILPFWVGEQPAGKGRIRAQTSPLAKPQVSLDCQKDFWESQDCHVTEFPVQKSGLPVSKIHLMQPRPWRGLLFLGLGHPPKLLRGTAEFRISSATSHLAGNPLRRRDDSRKAAMRVSAARESLRCKLERHKNDTGSWPRLRRRRRRRRGAHQQPGGG